MSTRERERFYEAAQYIRDNDVPKITGAISQLWRWAPDLVVILIVACSAALIF